MPDACSYRPPVVEVPGGERRVLLHVCCAPCSGAVLECLLANGIRPALFFSNSNIVPAAEYLLRRDECIRYAESLGLDVVEDDYDHPAWQCIARGLENEPERGARCLECFKFRLVRAARYAAANAYPGLATTLAASRWKDLDQGDAAGRFACSLVPGVQWWAQNWRKGGLQQRRSEISREQQFYNQPYCGCEYSFQAP